MLLLCSDGSAACDALSRNASGPALGPSPPPPPAPPLPTPAALAPAAAAAAPSTADVVGGSGGAGALLNMPLMDLRCATRTARARTPRLPQPHPSVHPK